MKDNPKPTLPEVTEAAPVAEPSRPSFGLIATLLLAVVLVAAVAVRFITMSDLWLDEALTVNVANLPLSDLREALERDGAPPLYYVLLHFWMVVFGTADFAVRALSGALGVLMLFLSFRAGLRLGGTELDRRRWIAWSAVIVVATSPYTIRYSTETRMYMLTMVLVLIGYLALRNALEKPTLGWLAVVSLVTAALLYTQYWALFLLAVVGLIQVVRAWRAPTAERSAARRITGALVVGTLLFLPWIPTFLFQLRHTGTPWDTPASPPTNAALGILDFAGGRVMEGWTLVLPLLLLALLALFGRPTDKSHIAIDLHTVAGVRWEWLVGAATLFVGLFLSLLTGTGFQARYAAIMFPFFALVVAYGVIVFADKRIRMGILAFVAVVGFVGGARNVATNRTQATQVVEAIAAEAQPGDVVGYCPDQLGPAVSRLIDAELQVANRSYPYGGSPRFVNWVDYEKRNREASAERFADKLLTGAGTKTLWMVWAPGYVTFEGKCEAVLNALGASRPAFTDLVSGDDNVYEFMGLRRYNP